MKTKKRSPLGQAVSDHVAAEKDKSLVFAAAFDEEYERLEFARLVKLERERRGLSQAELAALVGMQQPAIARLERGRAEPRFAALRKIAAAMGQRVEVRFRPARRGLARVVQGNPGRGKR